jgi:hypothetical protein
MVDLKTSQEVDYTPNGEPGKQCQNCVNYISVDDEGGECMGHKVVATGHCNYFEAK